MRSSHRVLLATTARSVRAVFFPENNGALIDTGL